jgi:dihydrodipicolinate synthase/N-acetylneuraminate lyase
MGADAIIAPPPSEHSDPQTDLEYYKAIGGATALSLFVQAVGNMSVDLLIEMYKAIPTFRCVKDEAGNITPRDSELSEALFESLGL